MENTPGRPENPSDKPNAKMIRLFPQKRMSEETPVITDPEGPRHPLLRKLLSIISIIIVFVICVYLLRFQISGLISPKLYLSLVAGNTFKSLNREWMTYISGNNVIKRGQALLSEPYEQELQISAGAFSLVPDALTVKALNDNKRDQLLLEMSNNLGESAGFYLSDSILGYRKDNDVYSADSGSAAAEINTLLEAGGSDLRLPDGLELSYGAFKRLLSGGSIGAASPVYERIYSRYAGLAQSLFDIAKFKKSSSEKLSLGSKIVNCKAISIQISGQDMRQWLLSLADTLKNDADLAELLGKEKDNLENIAREQSFFHNGTIFFKFYCYGDRIICIRYSHVESQLFFEVSTLGEQYRLDNISFLMSGVHEAKFQAVSDHTSPDEFHMNLFVSGLGKLDALDQIQIVWEPSKQSDNVTLGKAGKTLGRFTFAENDDGIVADIPGYLSYTLTQMNERPAWPDDTASLPGIDWNRLKGLFMDR